MAYPGRNDAPPFDFVVHGPVYNYNHQVSPLNVDTTQQWMTSSRSQRVQHAIANPSTSMRIAMTPQNTGLFDRSRFPQAISSPIDNRIDPSLRNSMLAPPGQFTQSSYDPIARQLQEQPWSANNPRSSISSGSRSPLNQSHVQFSLYSGSASDIDVSDSGYHSQPAPSILSNDQIRFHQELPSSITNQVCEMNVGSTTSEAPAMMRVCSDARSRISSCSGISGRSNKQLVCPECAEVSKCKSDHKKHMLRHEKPYKCEEHNCKRGDEGFTTTNDLDRHKKSVHRIGLGDKSYQCASNSCRNKEKVWPRLDNFKQHIERMHKEEDHIDLISRSAWQPKKPNTNMEDMTVAPGDTSFAVTGMDRSFSGNPAVDNVPMMDLRMDHESSRWPSVDHGAQSLVHQFQLSPSQHGKTASRMSHSGPLRPQRRSNVYHRRPDTGRSSEGTIIAVGQLDQVVTDSEASGQRHSDASPVLSSAPQTKAEQQRSALQKLSRAISSPSDPIDLEEVILSVLHQATGSARFNNQSSQDRRNSQDPMDDKDAVTLTRSEALKASQAISNLIRQSPGTSYRVQRRSKHGFISNAKVCPKCDYTVARDCDLRKHMKRHDKPYGCTYPKCHKRFGAKSDWKRHENSQHFQLEAFRCAQKLASGSTCAQHFFRAVQFESHLKSHHKALNSDQQRQSELAHCRIGKNCQVRFWCGFCKVVVDLKERRNAAWDERFDHIAYHFEKEKKRIDEWVCVEENKPKKDLLKGLDRYIFDDEEERGVDAAGDVDDNPMPPPDIPGAIPTRTNPVPPPPPPSFPQVNARKRSAPADVSAPQRQSKRTRATFVPIRYCCTCEGPCGAMDVTCVNCAHSLCSSCTHIDEYVMDYYG